MAEAPVAACLPMRLIGNSAMEQSAELSSLQCFRIEIFYNSELHTDPVCVDVTSGSIAPT